MEYIRFICKMLYLFEILSQNRIFFGKVKKCTFQILIQLDKIVFTMLLFDIFLFGLIYIYS